MLKPTDALDDVVFVVDFAERLNLAYHRNDAHVLPTDNNLRPSSSPSAVPRCSRPTRSASSRATASRPR